MQLRVNAGERIFILEKDEINSRTASRSSSSRRSGSSNASETRARALAEAAKKKVEWQYAKLEMQKKVELKMKECEIEEMQRKKDYERAEVEAAALAKVEEEEEEDQKPLPDCLGDIPCGTDKEDHVRQYLAALPTTSAYTSTTSSNPVDLQHNTPVTVVSTTPLTVPPNNSTASTAVAYETPEVRSSEKILYLLQCLSGAPRKVVEGYQFASSPDVYQTAKSILEKRFGHPSVVADAFRKRLKIGRGSPRRMEHTA